MPIEAKNYIATLVDTKCENPNGNAFNGIWQSFEHVVLHSLVTSFDLDFLVQDQPGSDVDSIRNVRSSGFKSDEHRAAYSSSHGDYSEDDDQDTETEDELVSSIETSGAAYSSSRPSSTYTTYHSNSPSSTTSHNKYSSNNSSSSHASSSTGKTTNVEKK